MKEIFVAIVSVAISASSLWADTNDPDKITRMVDGCIPTNWVVTSSTKPVPIRGLSKPIAQYVFTETTRPLTLVLSPGQTNTFYPTLILLAFPSERAKEIDEAVVREGHMSDYPPLVFCLNDQYVFVTSPGYINRGLHTPEAEASLRDLKEAMARWTTVKYHIDAGNQRVPAEALAPIMKELTTRLSTLGEKFPELAEFAKRKADARAPLEIRFSQGVGKIVEMRGVRSEDLAPKGIDLYFLVRPKDQPVWTEESPNALIPLDHLGMDLYSGFVLSREATPGLEKQLTDIFSEYRQRFRDLNIKGANPPSR
jgi:hypothetical protein